MADEAADRVVPYEGVVKRDALKAVARSDGQPGQPQEPGEHQRTLAKVAGSKAELRGAVRVAILDVALEVPRDSGLTLSS